MPTVKDGYSPPWRILNHCDVEQWVLAASAACNRWWARLDAVLVQWGRDYGFDVCLPSLSELPLCSWPKSDVRSQS